MPFKDRADAGRHLAPRLGEYAHRSDVVVLALPRGGVPVGFEVASALEAPLDYAPLPDAMRGALVQRLQDIK